MIELINRSQFKIVMILLFLYELLFQCSRFLIVPTWIYKIDLLICALFLIYIALAVKQKKIPNIIYANKFPIVCILAYCVWDRIRAIEEWNNYILYDRYKYFIIYFIIIFAVIIGLISQMPVYTMKIAEVQMLSVFGGSLIIGVRAIINAIVPADKYVLSFNISLVDDYNQFSEILLIGAIWGYWLLSRNIRNYKVQMLFLALGLIFYGSVIYLSASRRSILEMFTVFGILVLLFIFRERRYWIQKTAVIIVAVVLATITITALQNVKIEKTQQLVAQKEQQIESNQKGEKEPVTNVPGMSKETTEDIEPESVEYSKRQTSNALQALVRPEGYKTRGNIWSRAIDHLASYNGVELLFGRGEGEARKVYDGETYPHNLFLEDLIEGGVIKALLALAFIIAVFIEILAVIRMKKLRLLGICILFVFAIILANILISGEYSILGDVNMYWSLIILFLIYSKRNDGDSLEKI